MAVRVSNNEALQVCIRNMWVGESGATARKSLGVTIGTDVQAYDAQLADIAGMTVNPDSVTKLEPSPTMKLESVGVNPAMSSSCASYA